MKWLFQTVFLYLLLVSVASALEWSPAFTIKSAHEIESGREQMTRLQAALTVEHDVAGSWQINAHVLAERDLQDVIEPVAPNRDSYAEVSQPYDAGNSTITLREFALTGYLGNVDLSVGKQQIVWGKADGIKVLDIVNPQSLREFLIEDYDKSRIALWSLKLGVPVGGRSYAELIAIPDLSFTETAQETAAFEVTSTRLRPSAEFALSRDVKRPENDVEWGGRWQSAAGPLEYSLVYFNHYNDLPKRSATVENGALLLLDELVPVELPLGQAPAVAQPRILVTESYVKTDSAGIEWSLPLAGSLLRAEALRSNNVPIMTRVQNPLARQDVLARRDSWLVGVDRTFGDAGLISLQYSQTGYRNAGRGDAHFDINIASLLLRESFRSGRVTASAFLTVDTDVGDYLVRPRLEYLFSDAWTVELGADLFEGERNGIFGQFEPRSRIFVSLHFHP